LLYDGLHLDEVEPMILALDDHPRVDIRRNTTAFGLYEGSLLGAFEGGRFLKLRARQIIVCTGGRERPFVFQNNDLPGVFLARGVQRLARLHGVLAGRKAVVVTDHDDGNRVAKELLRLGIEIAAVVDPRPEPRYAAAGKTNWPNWKSGVVLGAQG